MILWPFSSIFILLLFQSFFGAFCFRRISSYAFLSCGLLRAVDDKSSSNFLTQKIKTRKSSQLGGFCIFAYFGYLHVITGRNEENNSILTGVTFPHAHVLCALVFSLSLPFDACHAGYSFVRHFEFSDGLPKHTRSQSLVLSFSFSVLATSVYLVTSPLQCNLPSKW